MRCNRVVQGDGVGVILCCLAQKTGKFLDATSGQNIGSTGLSCALMQ